MMGRKAMPVDLLLVKGKKNLTKREIEERRKAEQKLKANSDKVKPPTFLDAFAKREFRKIVNEAIELDTITNLDVNQLAIYCRTYSRWVELTKKQIEGEFVDDKELDRLFKQIKSMATEFGFTPSSRAKIAMPKTEKEEPSETEKRFGNV